MKCEIPGPQQLRTLSLYVFIRCLAKFGIYPSRTHGADDRLRFHSDNPVKFIDGTEQAQSYYFTLEDVAIGNPKVRQLA